MADGFWDPVNGSDANTGLSFAQRKKTLGSFSQSIVNTNSLTRIKCIENQQAGSSSPQLVVSAGWTDASPNVTSNLAGICKTIHMCDAVWTAGSGNVTTSVVSTSGNYKEGTGAMQAVVATAFTTGKIASVQIGGGSPVDFSAYTRISFWIKSTLAIAANNYQIKLCSDTAGNTPVNTLTLNRALKGSVYKPVVLDNGGALGSNIQSVAIYSTVDQAAFTLQIDDIFACLPESNAQAVTLLSQIGKNIAGDTFYPLQSINPDTGLFVIGASITVTSGSVNLRGYVGTTGTANLYRRETFNTFNGGFVDNSSQTVSSGGTINFSGAAGAPIEISGGWNATDMSTQTGESWFDAASNSDLGMRATSQSYLTISKLNFARYYAGIWLTGCNNITLTNPQNHGTFAFGVIEDGDSGGNTFTSVDCQLSGNYNIFSGNNSVWTSPKTHGSGLDGFCAAGHNAVITDLSSRNNVYGIDFYYSADNKFYRPSTNNSSTAAMTGAAGTNYVVNGTFPESVEFVPTGSFEGIKVWSYNHDNTSGTHKCFGEGYTISSDTSTREKAVGPAWRIDVTSLNRTSTSPALFGAEAQPEGFKVIFDANRQVTVQARVRRSNTGLTLKMLVPGGRVAGVPSDVVATASAAQDAWETLSLSFTPTEAGALDVIFQAYGGTTYSAWVDSFPDILQAA